MDPCGHRAQRSHGIVDIGAGWQGLALGRLDDLEIERQAGSREIHVTHHGRGYSLIGKALGGPGVHDEIERRLADRGHTRARVEDTRRFDAEDGVPAPLFEIKRRAGRKADSTIRQVIRCFSALSVDVLITAGMKLDDAAGEVANVLRKCGVTAHGGGGKQITALTVVNWRTRVRADYGRGIGAEIYEEYRDRIAFVDGANETANRAFILNRLEHFVLETRARDEQPLRYAT